MRVLKFRGASAPETEPATQPFRYTWLPGTQLVQTVQTPAGVRTEKTYDDAMRLYMQNKWILIPIGIVGGMFCHLIQGQEPSQNIHVVLSPNKKLEIVWCDIEDSHREPIRVITGVDLDTLKSWFSEVSHPRYTGAIWNSSSERCAIYDAPDNATTSLWILLKRANGDWERKNVEVFKLIERGIPAGAIPENPRGGIENLRWETDARLLVNAIYSNKHYYITIETSCMPFTERVIRIKGDQK